MVRMLDIKKPLVEVVQMAVPIGQCKVNLPTGLLVGIKMAV